MACAAAPFWPIDPTASETAALIAYGGAYASVATCVLGVGGCAPDLGRLTIAVVFGATLALVSLASAAPTALDCAIVLVLLLAAGTSAGGVLGARIEHVGHLLPVAIVSSLADLVSVLTPGAPSDVVVATPALLSVLAVSWPMPGTHDLPAILGVGDIAFVALYFAAARKHGLSRGRTAVALALGLAVTAVVVARTALPIPALPFLGAAMLAAHPAARSLPGKDRRAALVGLIAIALALGALVLFRRSG
jgi:hypothetical protein